MNLYKKIEKLEKTIVQLSDENKKYKYNILNLEEKQRLADEKYDEYCKLINDLNILKKEYEELIKQLKKAVNEQPKVYKKQNKELKRLLN